MLSVIKRAKPIWVRVVVLGLGFGLGLRFSGDVVIVLSTFASAST